MRRSICYCEPNVALAGQRHTWKFLYTPASNLPKGTRLKFDLASKGRSIDWETPEAHLKKGNNVIYMLLESGKLIQSTPIEVSDNIVPQFEFILPQEVLAGTTVTICVGAAKEDHPEDGTMAQTMLQRRRPFLLYIDPSGKGNYQDPEVFSLDVRGNVLQSVKILVPSFVIKNKRFDVIVRFEDEFGNLTSNAPENTLIELFHENLRENLNWKLFIPETGFITLPNLYFNEAGVYTIRLRNLATQEVFSSSPIKCFATDVKSLFWGMLHGESERIDSTENIESCLRHFRDEKSMSFFAVSPFESLEETSNEIWKLISHNVSEFNEDERFSVSLGFQWEGEPAVEGMRHFLFSKDEKPVLRKKDQKSNSLKKIYKLFSSKELISIPTFTMGKGHEFNFEEFDPEYERVVEIYNAWGSSELTSKEGNRFPINSQMKDGVKEAPEGSILKALLKNHRFGFVAGGLDDRGTYSNFFQGDQEQYSPGYTGIFAETLTRQAVFDALYNRCCYATSGERIILGLFLAGLPMGSETDTIKKPGLVINRHISGYVAGTCRIQSVEIIRNGEVIKTFTSDTYHLDFDFDDMTPLHEICLESDEKKPPFAFYYLRVMQEDGHMAWSSPIWVDSIVNGIRIAKKPLLRPVKKGTKTV